MIVAGILLSLILGFLLGYFLLKLKTTSISSYNSLQEKFQEQEIKLNAEMTKCQLLEKSMAELSELREKNLSAEIQYSKEKGRADELQKLYSDLKMEFDKQSNELQKLRSDYQIQCGEKKILDGEIEKLQERFKSEFEVLAKRILEENSEKFAKENKVNIEGVLSPLRDNIDSFKKKVEETYEKESKERFSLGDRIKELVAQTDKISSEANNLASALKGEAKTRGDWGEMILESILQQSGLEKGREYFVQPNIKDELGKSQRPDIMVTLPDKRVIIIDSKVSLIAYDAFMSANSQEIQSIKIKEHIASLKSHIDNLFSKEYDKLEESLDFTMMFIPIEPAYLIAIKEDPELWYYAYSKRILLVSPTNLIACLKLMSDLWKREKQSKNAMEIVRRGELMFDKFVGFIETIQSLKGSIDKSSDFCEKAISQLKDGRGNLLSQARQLKDLGLKVNKELPISSED